MDAITRTLNTILVLDYIEPDDIVNEDMIYEARDLLNLFYQELQKPDGEHEIYDFFDDPEMQLIITVLDHGYHQMTIV